MVKLGWRSVKVFLMSVMSIGEKNCNHAGVSSFVQ